MKSVLVLFGLLAVCVAHPQLLVLQKQPVSIQRTQFLDDSGQFSVSYHNSDGHSVEDIGVLKPNNDKTDFVLARQGSYRYISPEGIPISFSYIADEYGFRPVSNPAAAPVATPAVRIAPVPL